MELCLHLWCTEMDMKVFSRPIFENCLNFAKQKTEISSSRNVKLSKNFFRLLLLSNSEKI